MDDYETVIRNGSAHAAGLRGEAHRVRLARTRTDARSPARVAAAAILRRLAERLDPARDLAPSDPHRRLA